MFKTLSYIAAFSILSAATVACTVVSETETSDDDGTQSAGGGPGAGGAGGDASGAGGAGHVFAFEGWARNTPEQCEGSEYAVESAAEVGSLAAARLTPPSYPFEATEVVYVLASGDFLSAPLECSVAHEHRVLVFKGTGVSPADATLVETITVAAGVDDGNSQHVYRHDLDNPIRVDQGEYLFVAVELAGDASTAICMLGCSDVFTPETNYWSPAEPFQWTDLANRTEQIELSTSIWGRY